MPSPPIQQARCPPALKLPGGKFGKSLLGAAQPAVHQLVGPKHDRVFAAAAHQLELDAIFERDGIKPFPGIIAVTLA
jgi:hypothetical protein